MAEPTNPNALHCRADERYCRGETYCACQCDKCRAAYEAGKAFYDARRKQPEEDSRG